MSGKDRPTAFIIENSGTLLSFVQLVNKYSLKIPEEFSVVAYDDIPEADTLGFKIATIGPSIRDLTKNALDILASKPFSLTGKWADIEIEPELTIRNSVSRAK